MSAARVFQSILPFSWNGNNNSNSSEHEHEGGRFLKRRKTHPKQQRSSSFHSPPSCAIEIEDTLSVSTYSTMGTANSDEFDTCTSSMESGCSNTAPSPQTFLSHLLADQGLPDRLDPYSIDHFMNFESDGDGHGVLREMPSDWMTAIRLGDIRPFTNNSNCSNRHHIQSLRTVQGETLLHVACRHGQHHIVDCLLRTHRSPVLVLDSSGRNPLHSLCIAMRDAHASFPPRRSRNQQIAVTVEYVETIKVLVHHTPMLTMYKDSEGKPPLEYIHEVKHHSNEIHTTDQLSPFQQVNALLVQERVVDRVVQELFTQRQLAHSETQMTAMEKVDRMINLEGVDAAILECGFSI